LFGISDNSGNSNKCNVGCIECLQCFESVGWVSGRLPGLKKLSDEVLMWLSDYPSGTRCRLFAHVPADATASPNPIISCLFKTILVLPLWYRITEVVLEKRPLNGFKQVC